MNNKDKEEIGCRIVTISASVGISLLIIVSHLCVKLL